MVCDRHACSSFSRRLVAGGSVYCACHTKRQPRASGGHARRSSSTGGSAYCTCHTKSSRRPAAATRAAALPGSSVYCACHETGSRGHARRSSSRRMHAMQLLQEALCIASATRKAARKLCVLRLPHERACHTKGSRAPGGSVYCACHTRGVMGEM